MLCWMNLMAVFGRVQLRGPSKTSSPVYTATHSPRDTPPSFVSAPITGAAEDATLPADRPQDHSLSNLAGSTLLARRRPDRPGFNLSDTTLDRPVRNTPFLVVQLNRKTLGDPPGSHTLKRSKTVDEDDLVSRTDEPRLRRMTIGGETELVSPMTELDLGQGRRDSAQSSTSSNIFEEISTAKIDPGLELPMSRLDLGRGQMELSRGSLELTEEELQEPSPLTRPIEKTERRDSAHSSTSSNIFADCGEDCFDSTYQTATPEQVSTAIDELLNRLKNDYNKIAELVGAALNKATKETTSSDEIRSCSEMSRQLQDSLSWFEGIMKESEQWAGQEATPTDCFDLKTGVKRTGEAAEESCPRDEATLGTLVPKLRTYRSRVYVRWEEETTVRRVSARGRALDMPEISFDSEPGPATDLEDDPASYFAGLAIGGKTYGHVKTSGKSWPSKPKEKKADVRVAHKDLRPKDDSPEEKKKLLEKIETGKEKPTDQADTWLRPPAAAQRGNQFQAIGCNAYAYAWATNIADIDSRGWEWLHVRGRSLGGPTKPDNLVLGTEDANTHMIPFENHLGRLAGLLTDKTGWKLDVSWQLPKKRPGNGQRDFEELKMTWKLKPDEDEGGNHAEKSAGEVRIAPLQTVSRISKQEVGKIEDLLKEQKKGTEDALGE